MTGFNSLDLPAPLQRALAKANFTQPTPIQQQAIPAIAKGRDVLGIAKTGSGKTAGYVLPILARIQRSRRKPSNRHIQVLVLVPTRELAVQVGEVFQTFGRAFQEPVRTMAVYGGVSINPQMKNLNGVRILIATPGRLLDLLDSKALHLSEVETLVLDEADKMLNLGFRDEMNRILSLLPQKRQNLLFSATLSPELDSLNQLVLADPVVVKIEEEKTDIELIQQSAYLVSPEQKGPLLRYLIKTKEMKQVLVFTSSVYSADNVANKLRKNGIDAQAIHGKKSQGARTDALQKFKAGTLRVLVATDLLARGIDIKFLPFVINYDLPRSPKGYIHRIGRTGRAENPGEAIAFVSEEELHHFKVIQKKMKKWVKLTYLEGIDLQGH